MALHSSSSALIPQPLVRKLVLVAVFVMAFSVRMLDLTDLPLDFHPTRQLFSALKARGIYYQSSPGILDWQRHMAVQQWQKLATIEPPFIEYLAAYSYRLFGEHLWIGRIYSSLFWIVGGLAIYLLAREIFGEDGAMIATGFYLFLPYGVIASRSFQPDPLMIALICWGLWGLFNWYRTATWRWAATAGILCGLAILVKNVAIFPLLGAALGLIFARGLRETFKDARTFAVAALAALPAGAYTIYGTLVKNFLVGQFDFRFFPSLWITPSFYIRWDLQANYVVGFGAFLMALFGVLLAHPKTERPLLLGLWVGYLAFGFAFSYHFSTHDYYQLPLIPIVALSIAPVARLILERILVIDASSFARTATVGLLLFGLAFQVWTVHHTLDVQDYRPEAQFWAMLGDKLGHSASVVSLTPDYGYRLAYWGWQNSTAWLYSGDIDIRTLANRQVKLVKRFQETVADRQFFIVTMFDELNTQPEIKDLLYGGYAIFDQGNGYIIFDLTRPLKP
jgi:4-amino-4-deoxy-L-arabinose transferase-like glycosyltransferase